MLIKQIDHSHRKLRNYENTVKETVRNHYRNMRSCQTMEYNLRMRKKYLQFDKPMVLWEAIEKLNDLIDVSDPDLDLPNIQHLIQSAEAIRNDNRPDWMQLTGLIHDLGKVMYLWGCDEDGTSQDDQWGLVGDVFAVGCRLPATCIYPEFNSLNPDMQDEKYNTDLGIYQSNCGIDNITLTWGHDEYLYQVLKNHETNCLPEKAMIMIRYHSFYLWHTVDAYPFLENEKDHQYKEWVLDFNHYDLYSKCEQEYDLEEMKSYYLPIAEKYLGTESIYW